MRISDWSSDVCSADLDRLDQHALRGVFVEAQRAGAARQHAEQFHAVDHAPDQGDVAVELARRLAVDHVELGAVARVRGHRSEEHTSELQSLMRISYAGFCLKKKKKQEWTSVE